MKKFEMSEAVLNEVLSFLSSKPYKEVYRMIQMMQADAKEIVPPVDVEHTKPEAPQELI